MYFIVIFAIIQLHYMCTNFFFSYENDVFDFVLLQLIEEMIECAAELLQ